MDLWYNLLKAIYTRPTYKTSREVHKWNNGPPTDQSDCSICYNHISYQWSDTTPHQPVPATCTCSCPELSKYSTWQTKGLSWRWPIGNHCCYSCTSEQITIKPITNISSNQGHSQHFRKGGAGNFDIYNLWAWGLDPPSPFVNCHHRNSPATLHGALLCLHCLLIDVQFTVNISAWSLATPLVTLSFVTCY